jgi:hypothetical protein
LKGISNPDDRQSKETWCEVALVGKVIGKA